MSTRRKEVEVIADPHCPECHGTGIVFDWVPYGSTNVRMESGCDCVHPRYAFHWPRFNDPSYEQVFIPLKVTA